MKKRGPIIIGILICIAVMGVSYFWAIGLMDSLYAYRSPLHDSPPKHGEVIGDPNTRSVVIVLIDALRYDTSLNSNVMPFLNKLRKDGASALMHSRAPSYSEPGYTVILTGAWPDISDGPAMNLDYADIPTFTQDDIFSAARRSGMQTAVSGFNWFEKLIPQQAVSTSFYTSGEDRVADRQVTDAALPWLQEGKYQLVLIHLDQVDYAGHHEGGPIDPRWNAAANRADGLLKEIASAMDLSQDTLLVISDHGQIDRGGHGGQDPVVLQEPFVMVGKGVIPGDYQDVQMVDVAPTIAALLGTSLPASNQGHPQVAMFDFTLAQVDSINNALSIQQAQLVQAYKDAIGYPVTVAKTGDIVSASQAGMTAAREALLDNQRLPRGIIALVIVFLLINLAAWNARPYYKWMLVGVIGYLLVFNIKYILIDQKTYSLSSVISETNLIASTGLTALLALFVGWLMVLLGTKIYQLRPRKAADLTIKFFLVTLSIFSIPIFINYVMNGATITWALPNFLLSFLGFLFLIQALMVAVIGLFLTALSALIGVFAR
jgi:hypothetical protein